MGCQAVFAVLAVMLLSGCGHGVRVDVPDSGVTAVVSAPPVVGSSQLPLPVVGGGVPSAAGGDDFSVDPFDYQGGVRGLCGLVALKLGLSFVDVGGDAGGEDRGRDRGEGGDSGSTVVSEVSLLWKGGSWDRFRRVMSLSGVDLYVFDRVLICGSSGSMQVVRRPPVSMDKLRPLLGDGVSAELVGAAVVLIGAPSAVAVAVERIERIRDLPGWAAVQSYNLPYGFDDAALRKWLELAGFAGQFEIVGATLLGLPDVLDAVTSWLESRPQRDCDVIEWRLRGDVGDLVELLTRAFPLALCDGAEWFYSESRGLLASRLVGGRRAAVLAYLHRHDPAPRPVVIRGSLMLIGKDSRSAVSLSLRTAAAIPKGLTALTEGAAFAFGVGDLSGLVSASVARDRSSSVIDFSAPGVVGDEIVVSSGRSVALEGGTIVTDGIVRQQVTRVNIGIDGTFEAFPVSGGWMLKFGVSLRSPAADPEAFSQLTRNGRVFVPRGASAVLLSVDETTASDSLSWLSFGGAGAVASSYVVVSVLEGYLQ